MSSESSSSKANAGSGAFCIVFFTKRKQGLSLEEYRHHYENVHMKLMDSIFEDLVRNPPASDPNISSREEFEPLCIRRQYLDHAPSKLFPPNQANSDEVEKMNFDCATTAKFRDEDHAKRFVSLVLGIEENAKKILEDEDKFLEMKFFRSCVVDEVSGY